MNALRDYVFATFWSNLSSCQSVRMLCWTLATIRGVIVRGNTCSLFGAGWANGWPNAPTFSHASHFHKSEYYFEWVLLNIFAFSLFGRFCLLPCVSILRFVTIMIFWLKCLRMFAMHCNEWVEALVSLLIILGQCKRIKCMRNVRTYETVVVQNVCKWSIDKLCNPSAEIHFLFFWNLNCRKIYW